MYGPIMPVMKNIGRKQTITASVATMIGGRISCDRLEHDSRGAFLRSREMAGDVLDVHDRVVDQQAQRQDQGEQRHAVDRVADQAD